MANWILQTSKRKVFETGRPNNMTDLIYISVVVLFFALSGVYVRFCEKL